MGNIKPGLFGIDHSNRDFTKSISWGKNQFNSSFPAALACYMSQKNLDPVYLKVDNQLEIYHDKISVSSILGLDYTSPNLFFAFERDYIPYQDIVIGNLPRIDLVTIDMSQQNLCLRGIEIKLTALPDNTTCELSENQYGSEIVVRPPTIVYLAVSIAKTYQQNRSILLSYLDPICSQIQDWTSPRLVLSIINELDELTQPRIKRDEISNIILGGGQKLLSPERRFDAIILNTPNLFD
ncbi:HindVP family restriction endonuclease [Crocosphaera sp. UHCC 0190]|uniref:HindVP family restriction endonuclease n=1 Tax=Crocosphaera sp. UHCC 0190 TaxID=3110246 RepID=UPI002B1FAE20|nr:HindVP family restriction endonuclease [Crocosphaera sp. UHCC 0190]MEA5510179.1 HindVP family restriction endonuclease [Crocosphaera sp. UHCC 0190]